MKTKFTSVFLGLLLGLISLNANADTFYITEGTQFKLIPGGVVAGITGFLWKIGTTDLPGTDINASGVLTQTLGLTTPGAVRTVTYTLQLLNGTTSCLSGLVTHTVYVLPKLIVAIDGNVAELCNNLPISTVLTATVGAIVGLPTGITIDNFVWSTTNGAGTASGVTNNLYTITNEGTYIATVAYKIAGIDVNLTKLTAALGTFSKVVQKLPAITPPTMSLGE